MSLATFRTSDGKHPRACWPFSSLQQKHRFGDLNFLHRSSMFTFVKPWPFAVECLTHYNIRLSSRRSIVNVCRAMVDEDRSSNPLALPCTNTASLKVSVRSRLCISVRRNCIRNAKSLSLSATVLDPSKRISSDNLDRISGVRIIP